MLTKYLRTNGEKKKCFPRDWQFIFANCFRICRFFFLGGGGCLKRPLIKVYATIHTCLCLPANTIHTFFLVSNSPVTFINQPSAFIAPRCDPLLPLSLFYPINAQLLTLSSLSTTNYTCYPWFSCLFCKYGAEIWGPFNTIMRKSSVLAIPGGPAGEKSSWRNLLLVPLTVRLFLSSPTW